MMKNYFKFWKIFYRQFWSWWPSHRGCTRPSDGHNDGQSAWSNVHHASTIEKMILISKDGEQISKKMNPSPSAQSGEKLAWKYDNWHEKGSLPCFCHAFLSCHELPCFSVFQKNLILSQAIFWEKSPSWKNPYRFRRQLKFLLKKC